MSRNRGLDSLDENDLAEVLLVSFRPDEARVVMECIEDVTISDTGFSGWVSQEGVAMPVLSAGFEVVKAALPRFDLIGIGKGGLGYSDIERSVDWLQALSGQYHSSRERIRGAFAVRAGRMGSTSSQGYCYGLEGAG